MQKRNIFISHIHQESSLAIVLNEWIESTFLGTIDVFVSSDGDDIPAGSLWLDKIDNALNNSNLTVILCSKQSIIRPWINFEAGCSWIKKIPLIPVCHSGLTKNKLPSPLSNFQGLDLEESDFAFKLINSIAKHFNINKLPKISYNSLQEELLKTISTPNNDLVLDFTKDKLIKTCFKLGYDYYVFLGLHMDKDKKDQFSNIIQSEKSMILQYLKLLNIDVSLPDQLFEKSYKEVVSILDLKFNEIKDRINAIDKNYLPALRFGKWLGSVLTYVSVSRLTSGSQVEALIKPFHIEFQQKLNHYEIVNLPKNIIDKFYHIDDELKKLISQRSVSSDDYKKIANFALEIIENID